MQEISTKTIEVELSELSKKLGLDGLITSITTQSAEEYSIGVKGKHDTAFIQLRVRSEI